MPFDSSGMQAGQSTVEYALVLAAFLGIVVGLGALDGLFGDGRVLEHALASAPFHLMGVHAGAVVNLFLV